MGYQFFKMNLVLNNNNKHSTLNINRDGELSFSSNQQKIIHPLTRLNGIKSFKKTACDLLLNSFETRRNKFKLVSYVSATSGASTLFEGLNKYRKGLSQGYNMDQILLFFKSLNQFPFYDDLRQKLILETNDNIDPCHKIIDNLLSEQGLNYSQLPLGLLPIGHNNWKPKSVLHHHLTEASHFQHGTQFSVYLSVAEEHCEAYQRNLDSFKIQQEKKCQSKFPIHFLTRPLNSGQDLWQHCMQDLNRIDADLISLKPVNHLVKDANLMLSIDYKKILIAYLMQLQAKAFNFCRKLKIGGIDNKVLCDAISFVEDDLNIAIPEILYGNRDDLIQYLFKKLNRPMRVCGVVNAPGHFEEGVFKLQYPNGEEATGFMSMHQIENDSKQMSLYQSSEFQNAFETIITTKNYKGEPFDFRQYGVNALVDEAWQPNQFNPLSDLLSIGMTDWITITVELPKQAVNQINNINDLLSKR